MEAEKHGKDGGLDRAKYALRTCSSAHSFEAVFKVLGIRGYVIFVHVRQISCGVRLDVYFLFYGRNYYPFLD
jgi:hypothetical protein